MQYEVTGLEAAGKQKNKKKKHDVAIAPEKETSTFASPAPVAAMAIGFPQCFAATRALGDSEHR